MHSSKFTISYSRSPLALLRSLRNFTASSLPALVNRYTTTRQRTDIFTVRGSRKVTLTLNSSVHFTCLTYAPRRYSDHRSLLNFFRQINTWRNRIGQTYSRFEDHGKLPSAHNSSFVHSASNTHAPPGVTVITYAFFCWQINTWRNKWTDIFTVRRSRKVTLSHNSSSVHSTSLTHAPGGYRDHQR